MDLALLKEFEPNESLLHRLDGRVKTCLFLGAIFVVVALRHWYTVGAVLFAAVFLFSTMQLPWTKFFTRMLIPFEVAWLVLLNLLFTQGHTIMFRVNLYFWVLPAYREGLALGVLVLLRIITAVSLAVLLALSTPMPEILATLRALHTPGIMVDLAEMMYRYILLVEETALSMRRAQLSRGSSWQPWYKQAMDVGSIAGHVLIKALDRSTRIYKAMLSRGYDEDAAVPPYYKHKISPGDLRFAYSGVLALVVVVASDLFLH
ncbi:MAG: cobalt ECF transporter T component CbiQ [Peptococcaceae bacterium]|nr:cobalt ECF transporter T component CbiQ [Peptococcaceae bacterium]